MERTVVGFDGSEHVRKALPRAADLAEDGVTLPSCAQQGRTSSSSAREA